MKYLLISPSEMETARFDRLCEHLDAESEGDRIAVLGHLMAWNFRWAKDAEMDNGLLWEVTEKRMGVWARHPKPQAFGNALVAARYVAPLESLYSKELLLGRSGFVALAVDGGAMLDLSWAAWHRRAANKERNALYLLEADKRMGAFYELRVEPFAVARAHGIDPEKLPDGWLVRAPVVGDGQDGCSTAGLPQDYRRTTAGVPQDNASGPRAGAPARAPAPPTSDVNVINEENNSTSTYPPKHVNNSRRGPTGRPKTTAQRDMIRKEKYENPLACLEALDDGTYATRVWRQAVQLDTSFCMQVLAEMTETDETWVRVGNPAALAMSRLKPRIREILQQKRGET